LPSAAWHVDCPEASTPPRSCGPSSTLAATLAAPCPSSRYNISAFHSPHKKPGTVITQQGYFLDSTNGLAALDTSFVSMPRREVETLDPQQRLLLEIAREAIDDAGETRWKGTYVGVYVGCYSQDWYDISVRDTQAHGIYQVLGQNDFMVSSRLSHELDLHGPSVTLRTACSASLIGVNEACMSIARGDCTSAIVGGTNIIMGPAFTAAKSEQGVLSPDGSCNTFSANANGYARGDGIVAIYLKHLADAVRDGNPVRAVVTGSAANHNGHTPTVSHPSYQAQEALTRQAYKNAGIAEIARTGFFECHGTGTRTGDPIEVAAVSACFDKAGMHIGSVKANLGHAEGAAGLVSDLKAVLSLENRIIPPNIKCFPRNPAIPFEDANLVAPTEPTPWPEDRDERVSINNFGLGGSNAHAIIESAASFIDSPKSTRAASNTPHLLLFSANTPASLKAMGEKYEAFLRDLQTCCQMWHTPWLTNESICHIAHMLSARVTRSRCPPLLPPPRPHKAGTLLWSWSSLGKARSGHAWATRSSAPKATLSSVTPSHPSTRLFRS
jgi:acyl transferase domain-containing protein